MDQSADAYTRPLAGVRLLVVEDNADCLKALKFMLESKGAEVQAAASAEQARAALVARRPHVVISDLSLPGEDGFSFLASVRALSPDRGSRTPAVAFSAMSPLHARVRAGEAGFQAFLRKPGDLLLLVPTVVRLMSLALAP